MIPQLSKKRLHSYKESLNIILDIAQTINQDSTIEGMLLEFENLLRDELEVGKILVYTNKDGEWKNLIVAGVSDEVMSRIDVDRDLLHYKTIENITMSHPPQLNGFDAVIPLYHRFHKIGFLLIGDVEEEQHGISPTIKHLKLIQIIANLIIVFIENKRMQEALLEQEALKREVELAARIQNQLIPGVADIPVLKDLIIQAYYQPHYGIGGDYYDIIKLSKTTIGFCIADVSGKGIGAAMLMSNFQAIIRSLFTEDVDLIKLVNQLNQRVNKSANNEKFITLFIGRYNLSSRKLTYINAGHLPPLLYDGKKQLLSTLDKGCIGLGMLDYIPQIEMGKLTINQNSKLLAFTDGLVEIIHEDKIETNLAELENTLCQQRSIVEDIAIIKIKIAELVNTGAIFDDVALIGMEFI